jgi:site-specific DNA recombinase
MNKAIGYIRVSTSEQENGPDAQRAALVRWCESNGAELVAVFEDRGISGAAEIDKRPGLLSALSALREHKADCLLVAKRDRLARDMLVNAMIERLVERDKARVVSADGVGNGSGPEAEMLRGIMAVFAQYERAIIRARTKAALDAKKAKGERIGQVPYGWSLGADGVHLVPDEVEQEIIRAARELKKAGVSLRAVGAHLASKGLLPRCGKTWHAKTVRGLIAAPLVGEQWPAKLGRAQVAA